MSDDSSGGPRKPNLSREGVSTQDGDGAEVKRHGSDFVGGLPRTSRITRTTEMPRRPCTACRYFRYDKGQAFMDYEGIADVPNKEGGFLKIANTPLFEHRADGGAYDSREYGTCTANRRNPQLTHRFCTCGKWRGVGKL